MIDKDKFEKINNQEIKNVIGGTDYHVYDEYHYSCSRYRSVPTGGSEKLCLDCVHCIRNATECELGLVPEKK